MVDRRKFIKTFGRGMILAGLSATTGYLVLKNHSNTESTCEFDFICENCKKHSSCSLPEAINNIQESSAN